MALHSVYSKELSDAFRRGHPIANPQPVDYGGGEELRPVEVGDVGYIQPALGYFVRLFNVHLDPGVQGQPDCEGLPGGTDFEPLRKYRIMFTKDTTPVFASNSVATKSLTPSLSGPFFGGFAEFSTSKDRGAILATPDPIDCYNALHILSYKEHARDNMESWHEFAVAEGHDIELEDLMLVTGVDRTTSWANAMFSGSRLEAGFGLEVQFANVGAGVKLACRYSWQSTVGALVNSGPAPAKHVGRITDGDEGEAEMQPMNVTSNQSLFVRHVRVKRRRWLGMKIAAQGEKDDDYCEGGEDSDDGAGGLGIDNVPGRAQFTDCLEPALDYILEHSDASIAVAHDDDLDLLPTVGSSADVPDVVLHGSTGMFTSTSVDDDSYPACAECGYVHDIDGTTDEVPCIAPGVALDSTSTSSEQSSPPAPRPSKHSPMAENTPSTCCSACGQLMTGSFVRALGTVFHKDCFQCVDCGDSLLQKFFPIDTPDGQQPVCERDYFRRLDLLCASCDSPLSGSYVSACGKKYHIEHFTCSVCPTVFAPEDSYYEHEGDVYCHFHFSTRCATKCAGCDTAILEQFVEVERDHRDECWHPECYMINKFWSVRIAGSRPQSLEPSPVDGGPVEPWAEEEARETAVSLKEKQARIKELVERIWTVLSTFEESAAQAIDDLLRRASEGQYPEAIRAASQFILHVEVLLATINDLDLAFMRLDLEMPAHVREAQQLYRKTGELFTLLSRMQESGERRIGLGQTAQALVADIALQIKILICIGLTGALKLEREHGRLEAVSSFLDKLHSLAVPTWRGDPGARRISYDGKPDTDEPPLQPTHQKTVSGAGTAGAAYGFRSLALENASESPFSLTPLDPELAKVSVTDPPSDLCAGCGLTIEEDCVRLGTDQRWHPACLACKKCGKTPTTEPAYHLPTITGLAHLIESSKKPTPHRALANIHLFVFDPESEPVDIFCTQHGPAKCQYGFVPVSRLEQYAFLLNVALGKLHLSLKTKGVMTETSSPSSAAVPGPSLRGSGEATRMKTAHLDRELCAMTRQIKRVVIIERPSGSVARSANVAISSPRRRL
ncbi:unnamed protein product [Peniophora sp. CBMAI 1063]|nr:unnamed protein product [Peniophora sp. CBMAI 1063]